MRFNISIYFADLTSMAKGSGGLRGADWSHKVFFKDYIENKDYQFAVNHRGLTFSGTINCN